LLSGNTFGAERWTDGKMVAPMLPIPPAITRCRVCEGFFWVDQAEVLGELHPAAVSILKQDSEQLASLTDWERNYLQELEKEGRSRLEEWLAAEQVRELSEVEYLRALLQGLASDRRQEIHLRLKAWWAGNDPLRDIAAGERPGFERSPAAVENLERLSCLLSDRSPEDRLMQAEIAREMGHFDEALRLLHLRLPNEYEDVAEYVRNLAEVSDPLVRRIPG
jgi:hypothetical protein